ncbi:hypothetical protein LCGC14_3117030 [marine sediment metagenome]|uniref:Uncharacterized protein n=1 Tax=marine sediment metagenome TaxID=412755 RepID=A0A0F8YTA5_9ZZZZ
MKIDKAIKLLEAFVQPGPTALDPGDQDAIKLGIEALKHIKRGRTCRGNFVDNLLPGETGE